VATNLILAFAGAAGVFAAVLALGMRPRARLEDIGGLIEPRPGPIERLQHKLTEADLEVTAGEFLRVSLLVGGGVALAAYLVTTAWAPALLGFAVGGLVYYTYLADRRDRRRQDYQDGLVDVIGLLGYGPEIAREDWAQVNARIRTGIPVEDALMELSRRRRDPILDTVAQTLVVVSKQGGRLSVALIGLQDTVRERVRIRRRVQAEQSQPMWELRLVAALPFLAVPVLRAVAEEYVAFWQTPLGQLFLLLSWGLTIVGFLVAQRYIVSATQVEESFGVVEVAGSAGPPPPGLPQKGKAASR